MYTKVIVLALAALAVAGPTHMARQNKMDHGNDKGKQMFNQDASCGKNSQVYCCNTETSDKLTGKGTFPINADIADIQNLLGQCNTIKVGVVPVDFLKKACAQETVCCAPSKQQGVANFGCTSIHT